MESLSITTLSIIKLFKQKKICLFTSYDFGKIFNVESKNTLKHLLSRLKQKEVICQLCRNKYQFLEGGFVSDFVIANFLNSPSYVSLESALSYYGLIDQFPYRISSISCGKSKVFQVNNKEFFYSKIKKNFFGDFEKIDDFLIASPEKAVFDYAYFVSKGLRSKGVWKTLKHNLKNEKFKEYFEKHADFKII
jgi:predicted transcriptional regulator of viral defense system